MFGVVGEALVDIVVAAGEEPVEHVGGSPANVAIALARLGNTVDFVTETGSDARGNRIDEHLRANGVTLVGRHRTARPTSTARAHIDQAGVATYDFDLTWAAQGEAAIDVRRGWRCLHSGSLATALEPGAHVVLEAMRAFGDKGLVSYDPNIRPRLEPDGRAAAAERVQHIAALAHIVKASDEDVDFLHPGREIVDVAAEWLDGRRTQVVVITRGAKGALALTADGMVDVEAPVVEVADTVGAGDAFMAALLDAYARRGLLDLGWPQAVDALAALRTAEQQAVLTEACIVAAITCARPGADPPSRRELVQDDRYARHF